jgi:signal transduction histidine kinase/DNA-binding response OmpR family regulator
MKYSNLNLILKTTVAFCLNILLSCIFVSAQQNYDSYVNVTLERNPSSVCCFIQDSDGMMWIGGDKGLYSYDGYNVYPHFEQGAISNTHINCGLLIGHSYLYLGADNGLLVYNYRTNSYSQPLRRALTDVRSLARDGNKLWIGTLNGLYLFDLVSHRLVRFDAKKCQGLPHNTIYSIIRFDDGRMYFGTYNGLCYYDSRSRRFHTITLPRSAQKNNVFVNALLEDYSRRCIWVGTEGNLFQYFPSTNKINKINQCSGNSIKVLELDKDKRLLIGTDNGLYVYSEQKGSRLVLHDSRNVNSLSNDIIWSLFRDSGNNVWIGTDSDLSISSYSRTGSNVSLSRITGRGDGNQFYDIYCDKKRRLWLGGSNGLIQSVPSLNNPVGTIWYQVKDKSHSLPHNRIRKIVEDRTGNLWMASDGGVLKYDEGSRMWRHFNLVDKSHTLNANWAYDLFEDRKGQMWIATCLGGIFVVDKHKLERSTSYCEADYNFNKTNGLDGRMFVNQIAEDREGNVWVLLYNNVVQKIQPSTKKVSTMKSVVASHVEGLNYLFVDSEGRVWLAYRGGLLCQQHRNATFVKIPLQGMGQTATFAMTEVKNHIWVSTTDGLWMIDKRTMMVQHIGNISRSFTSIYYDAPSNMLYLGYKDGVFMATPEQLCNKQGRYRLQLTAVSVNNKLWNGQKGSIRYAETLYFKSSENHIDFNFSDLPYAQQEKGNFEYQLEGKDKGWNALPVNTNHITFDNLEAGKYTLLVRKIDSMKGHESEMLVTHFVILPPWYYSWWAKTIYSIILLLLLCWIINFFRVKSRLRFEQMEKQRIIDQTNQKLDFFANISHDFKTPLSMIIAPLSRILLEVDNLNMKKQLEMVQKNAMKINSMIHQILDFDRIDNNTHASLLLSKVNGVEFFRGIFSSFQEGAFKVKNMNSSFTSNVEQMYIDIDVLKMESAVTNILSNAAKYTPEGGTVLLDFHVEAGNISITIKDNGIGIPSKDLPYVSQRFFQSSKTAGKKEGTGIGLYLAKTYTELHGGTFEIQSEEGHGTSIILSLPVKENDTMDEPSPSSAENLPLVLVVDDSKDMSNFIVHILQPYFNCKVAYDGKEGLKLCEELQPDLVIADMMMPVMNGLEMCQHIRKNIPTSLVPIIMLTAKDDKQTEIESIRLNVDAFLSKPFDANVLLLRARQLVSRHSLQGKKERMEQISAPKEIVAVSQDEKFLQQVTQCIEEHINDFDLNVNSLCEQMNMGNKMIYRKLKQLTGMSPVDYIKSIRMKKAAMLLKQHKFTVAEVMYMVGFSNSSYFSKCFQSAFGQTPRQYIEVSKD